MQYAYARVSAADQNLGRQIEDFLKFGIKQNRIFATKKVEKTLSAKNTPVLSNVLKREIYLLSNLLTGWAATMTPLLRNGKKSPLKSEPIY